MGTLVFRALQMSTKEKTGQEEDHMGKPCTHCTSAHVKQVDIAVSEAAHLLTCCLKPTSVEKIYFLMTGLSKTTSEWTCAPTLPTQI